MKPNATKFWLLIIAIIPLGIIAGQFRVLESSQEQSVGVWEDGNWSQGFRSETLAEPALSQGNHTFGSPLSSQPIDEIKQDRVTAKSSRWASNQNRTSGFVPHTGSSSVELNQALSQYQAATPDASVGNLVVPESESANRFNVKPVSATLPTRPVTTAADPALPNAPSFRPVNYPSTTNGVSTSQLNYQQDTAIPSVAGTPVIDDNGQTRIVLPASVGQSALGSLVSPANEAAPSSNKHPALKPSSTVKAKGDSITLRLNNEDLRSVLEMISLESELSILPSENVKGLVTANISNVAVMDALEAILFNAGFKMQHRDGFVFVGTAADFDRMEQISLPVETRVIRPCFVSAQELSSLIKPMLTSSGTLQVTSAATHGLAQSGGTSSGALLGGNANGSNGGASAGTGNYTGNDILVIRDVPTALLRAEELINEIDVPPLQVAIEALILSVKLDDKHRLGVNLELLKGDGVRVVSGNLPGTLDSLETGQGLLSLGFLEANVGSFIAALDDIGETNVIAAPHVLALNKMSAEILIGEQIGFANTTVTQTAATQSIQFLDVGTQLQLRPHVNDEGLIRLEIHPEVSQGTVRSVGDLALPEKTVTQVTTNVMCRDNETIIIGGLIREEVDDVHRGIPLVGKMPVLGPLFRSRNRNTSREELLVLLTPHVVRDPADAIPDSRVVNNFVDRRASILINEKKNWALRKQEAQRYVSLARNAWVSGNPSACQRYSNIAIELDPNCAELLSFAPEVFQQEDSDSESWEVPTQTPTKETNPSTPDPADETAPPQLHWSPSIEVRDPDQLQLEAPPQVSQSSAVRPFGQPTSVQQSSQQTTGTAEDARQFLDFLQKKQPASSSTAVATEPSKLGIPFGAKR